VLVLVVPVRELLRQFAEEREWAELREHERAMAALRRQP
jgi:hypothetical protein